MANQSVLELAVGTGKWDAGLKKAKSALDNFTQANGGLQQALDKESQKMQKFVQMMGGMESTAKTAKGQMNDYKSTIEQLTMQYNRMTEAQKKAIGQDYLQAIDQMKQKYQSVNEEIQEMNRSLNKVKLPDMKDAGGGGLFSGLGDKMSGALQVFAGNMLTKAAGAVANLGSEIADMVKQGVELAKQGEGIRIAFERLGRGDILDGLRQATHGTVTDLELMKAAVKFNDFKLPVDELGTMLAFAQQKAKDTGQSVDYMVDSIVTGLGRKSLMILDNLGLSATEVKEKMAETGDMTKAVGAIIREQMSKAGEYVETAADRAAQADVELKNSMEELGRTFQPLTDASNSLWNSIKVGALDALNIAVKPLIQALAEAGTLGQGARSSAGFNNLGGNSKVDRMIGRLGNGKSEGAYSIYQQQLGEFDKYINNKRFQIAAYGGDNSSVAQSAKAKLQTELDGALKMREEYVKRAQELHNQVPSPYEPPTTSSTTNAKGGSSKTIKTEEQLNNDEIQKLTQEYIKASDDRRKAIEGEIKTLQDRNKEIARLKDMALGKIGDDGSLPAMTQQLKEFQNDQSESANGREWDDYQKKIDDVTAKINVLKGVLPKDQQATFTVDVNAEQMEQLRMLLPAEDETIRINFEEGRVNLPEIPKEDETIRVNITATTADAMKEVRDMVGEIEGWQVEIEPKIEIKEEDLRTPFEKLQDSIRLELSEKNIEVDKNALKSLTEVVTQYDIKTGSIDMSAIMAQTEELTKNGMSAGEAYAKALQDAVASNIDLSIIQQRIGKKIDIPDEMWQALQDNINEKLKELGIEPIKIDFKTGNIAKDGKDVAKEWNSAANAISSVGSAMQSIEDPSAKIVGTIAQAIATIALTYAQSLKGTFTPWDWIAGAASGMATMMSVISAIHSSTGYANGGIVKGNSYSGDNIPAMIDGGAGGFAGLNAGEIVLNKAAQGNLASQLQGAGMGGMQVIGEISGEKIVLVANRFFKRTGQGEIVTW